MVATDLERLLQELQKLYSGLPENTHFVLTYRFPAEGRAVAVDIEDGIKKILIPEFQKWIPVKYLKHGSWDESYDKAARVLTLTNGSFLEFMSYEQEMEKFAGTSRHFVFFDEEPPEDIFNECLMRLVDTDGDYWISMTPLIEMSWIKDRIYDPWSGGEASIYVQEVDTEENPHISIDALNRITRRTSLTKRNLLDAQVNSLRTQGWYSPDRSHPDLIPKVEILFMTSSTKTSTNTSKTGDTLYVWIMGTLILLCSYSVVMTVKDVSSFMMKSTKRVRS